MSQIVNSCVSGSEELYSRECRAMYQVVKSNISGREVLFQIVKSCVSGSEELCVR